MLEHSHQLGLRGWVLLHKVHNELIHILHVLLVAQHVNVDKVLHLYKPVHQEDYVLFVFRHLILRLFLAKPTHKNHLRILRVTR